MHTELLRHPLLCAGNKHLACIYITFDFDICRAYITTAAALDAAWHVIPFGNVEHFVFYRVRDLSRVDIGRANVNAPAAANTGRFPVLEFCFGDVAFGKYRNRSAGLG